YCTYKCIHTYICSISVCVYSHTVAHLYLYLQSRRTPTYKRICLCVHNVGFIFSSFLLQQHFFCFSFFPPRIFPSKRGYVLGCMDALLLFSVFTILFSFSSFPFFIFIAKQH